MMSLVSVLAFAIAFALGAAITTAVAPWLLRWVPSRFEPRESAKDEPIQILVMGDIGRSPRMQYHALSIASHGGKVDIVGFKESARHPDMVGNRLINIYPLPPQPEVISWGTLPFFVSAPLKALFQFATLFNVMAYQTPAAKWIIIQNPPSIPTFHVALLISLLRGSHLLIDWHNFGWTIMATARGRRHPFVWLYRQYETLLGRVTPTANLTVTDAMARVLREPPYCNPKPTFTLHDRPAAAFQPLRSDTDRLALLARLPETKAHAQSIMAGTTRLLVSSTSWTPDEDFGLLLDALVAYADPGAGNGDAPIPVLAVITGKGPQKAAYETQVASLRAEGRLPGVTVLTAWLSVRDYALLLASADLGVCLHRSSSGVDLPMKVVDMFGAGLPVAAYAAYESFGELVRDGVNGCGFETAGELAAVLRRLLSPEGAGELRRLREGAVEEGRLRWDEEWDRVVGRLIGLTDN